MKTGFSLIDFDVVFLMQSPEFIKLLNLGNNLKKKNCKKKQFKISFSVEIYDEKTAENDQNCNVTEKLIVSKLSEISILNFSNTN